MVVLSGFVAAKIDLMVETSESLTVAELWRNPIQI